MTDDRVDILKRKVTAYELSDEQAGLLLSYYDMMMEANSRTNLTSICDFSEACIKHFSDSLEIVRVLPEVTRKGAEGLLRMIDIGSGAGLPGIPIRVISPAAEMTLIDSLQKRVHFLETVIDRLGLRNIQVYHGRAEELAHRPDMREAFDCCVARAVAPLSVLAEYSLPFVKDGGLMIAYKGADIDEELHSSRRALDVLKAQVESVERFSLPAEMGDRSLIVLRKVGATPKKYPRRAGLPAKDPIES